MVKDMNKIKRRSFNDSFVDYIEAFREFEGDSFDFTDCVKVKTITFQVTEACNLNCSYCYQINKSPNRMSFDTAKKFIDMLIEDSYKEDSYVYVKDTGSVIFEFIGGEPLLEIDLISKIVEYTTFKLAKEKHVWAKTFMISMISNGVNYFDDNVQVFIKKYNSKLSFSMSLDGCKELHDSCRVFYDGRGSYDMVEKACKHYMDNYNPKLGTKMTFAPENIGWTYQAFKNLIDIGYKVIFANPIYEGGWRKEDPLIFYNQLKDISDYILDNDLEEDIEITLFDDDLFDKKPSIDNQNYCGSVGYMLALDYEGCIYPCLRFMKSSLGKNIKAYKIGDIHNGIGRSVKCDENINLLNSLTRRSQSTDKCFDCPIGSGCGWCTAYNYQEFGTPNKRATYICDMHKSRSMANVYYWNKYYKKNNIDETFNMNIPKEWALEIISEDEYNNLLELSSTN